MMLQQFGPMAVDDPLALAMLVVAGAFAMTVAWWSWNRAMGDGTDPSITLSKSSKTGQSSFLVSGIHAVALMAAVASVLAFPVLGIWPALVLAGVVAVHWIWEREEVM